MWPGKPCGSAVSDAGCGWSGEGDLGNSSDFMVASVDTRQELAGVNSASGCWDMLEAQGTAP